MYSQVGTYKQESIFFAFLKIEYSNLKNRYYGEDIDKQQNK